MRANTSKSILRELRALAGAEGPHSAAARELVAHIKGGGEV
jgi:hypothetical protein